MRKIPRVVSSDGLGSRTDPVEINDVLRNMAKGLILHYLQGRTVDAAIAEGKEGGLPAALVDCLPGVMFQVTIGPLMKAGTFPST